MYLRPNHICQHRGVHGIFVQDALIAPGTFKLELIVVFVNVDGFSSQELGRNLRCDSRAQRKSQYEIRHLITTGRANFGLEINVWCC